MGTPPDPHIPDILLAVAAKLGFRPTSRDPSGQELGVLTDTAGDRPLVVGAGSAPGRCVWALLDAGPAPRMAYLLTRSSYEALHGGTSTGDGALLFRGARYRLRAEFDGVATLLEEQATV